MATTITTTLNSQAISPTISTAVPAAAPPPMLSSHKVAPASESQAVAGGVPEHVSPSLSALDDNGSKDVSCVRISTPVSAVRDGADSGQRKRLLVGAIGRCIPFHISPNPGKHMVIICNRRNLRREVYRPFFQPLLADNSCYKPILPAVHFSQLRLLIMYSLGSVFL